MLAATQWHLFAKKTIRNIFTILMHSRHGQEPTLWSQWCIHKLRVFCYTIHLPIVIVSRAVTQPLMTIHGFSAKYTTREKEKQFCTVHGGILSGITCPGWHSADRLLQQQFIRQVTDLHRSISAAGEQVTLTSKVQLHWSGAVVAEDRPLGMFARKREHEIVNSQTPYLQQEEHWSHLTRAVDISI